MAKSQKTEERRRKKMFFTIIMILFVGIVLTASTYAWFTTNTNVQVNSLDVNVSASDGLQISVNASNWNPTVTIADLTGTASAWSGNRNQLPGATEGSNETLQPVSSAGVVTDGFMEMWLGKLDTYGDVYKLTASKDTESRRTSGNFVAFDIFFQSNKAQKLYLADGSGVSATGDTGIKNAARVAFLVQGSVDYGSTPQAAQALLGGTADSLYIWEPNYDTHTSAGRDNAVNTYLLPSNNFTSSEGVYTSAKLAYKGVKAEITSDNAQDLNSDSAEYFTSVTTHESPASGIGDTYMELFDLAEGVTKVRVYMWFEGQDVDCEDKASGGQVALDLKFSINATK